MSQYANHESSRGSYDGSYKIKSYVDFFDSYISSLIPWEDKQAYHTHLDRTYAVNGPIHGAIQRLSTLIARPLVIGGEVTRKDKESLNALTLKMKIRELSQKIITTMFVHPRVVVAHLPAERITCTCKYCKGDTIIGEAYTGTFNILRQTTRDLSKEERAAQSSQEASVSHTKPVPESRIRYVCPECMKLTDSLPTITPEVASTGVIKILEAGYTSVVKNPAGYETVYFAPETYDGVLQFDTSDLRYSDIKGVPWNMIRAYCSHGRLRMKINESHSAVLKFEELVTVSGEIDLPQLLPILDDTMTVSVMKRGNEALAASKINPFYLVSPSDAAQTSPQSRYSMINEMAFQEFILEQVKAHEEGDLGRIAYSPMPVNAQALFGDGKRFLVMNELIAYMRFALGSLGVNAGVLDGSALISADPVSLEILKMFSIKFNNVFLPFIKGVFKRIAKSESMYPLTTSGIASLYFESISDIPGTYSSQAYQGLAQSGAAPLDRLYRDVGLEMPYPEILQKIRQERIDKLNSDIEEDQQVSTIKRNEMLRQIDVQAQQGQIDTTYAAQAIRQQAEQIANDILPQMADGERKSYFNQLMKQDYVLYAVTIQLWDDAKKQNEFQAGGGPGIPQ